MLVRPFGSLSLWCSTLLRLVTMRALSIVIFLCNTILVCSYNPYPKLSTPSFEGDAGQKLIFSQFIKEGRIKEARDLSLVTGLELNLTSYAGYFTVNEECNSNLFFWFFPSQNEPTKDPIAVWLQGGPGTSSLYGLLLELGPYKLNSSGNIELNKNSWNKNASFIFIDNPVGTGFSYADSIECYAKEQSQVGQELLIALEQFFEVFPEYKANDFFITGESFAGHYIPALAYTIFTSNSTINLQGIVIGSGWVDPENQMLYSKYVYQIGLVDLKTREVMEQFEQRARDHIVGGAYHNASYDWNDMLIYVLSYSTGFVPLTNILEPVNRRVPNYFEWCEREEVRRSIHVGNATFHNDGYVYSELFTDLMRSYRSWLEIIMDKYRVLIYNGQLDTYSAYTLSENYIQKLQWSAAQEYRNAERKKWMVDNEIAGYSKTAGNFTEVLIRNAGHYLAADQPEWALDLINRFFNHQPIEN